MHWSIPTAVADVNFGGTFTINACQRTGAGRLALKKVTCKECKYLIEHPQTPNQAAALLYAQLKDSPDTYMYHIKCEDCDENIDTIVFKDEEPYVSIGRILTFLGHAAFDHAFSCQVQIVRTEVVLTRYALALAIGKEPVSQAEMDYRAAHQLAAPVSGA